MAMRRILQKRPALRKFLAASIVLAFALSAAPRPATGCGPFFEQAFFTYTVHPDFPLAGFAAGDLGVIQPTYARSYLAVAYRYLSGGGFDKDEQKALVSVWDERLGTFDGGETKQPVDLWLEARKKVVGAGEPPSVSAYRTLEGKEFYTSFLNCPDDAFKTAAETLDRMIQRFGAGSAEVKEWVQAQDQVFTSCSEGSNIPAPAAVSAPAMIKANRAYQIATANFYAMNFDAARKMFGDISADSSSPWRQVAPYLVARALIRKGTLVPAANKVDEAALAEGETQLKKILSDTTLARLHPSATGLLSFVRMRLKPEQHLHELAQLMLRKGSARTLKQDLIDFTLLLDRYVNNDEEKKFETVPKVGREDDITDWMLIYQVMDQGALDYSLRKWEQGASLPWLLAAISKINAGHPKAAALVEAAGKVKAGTPGFATASYHVLRLMIEAGRKDEARAALARLLASGGAQLSMSARNLFMALATRTSRSLDEFLKYAQRVPAGIGYDTEGRELPDKSEDRDKSLPPLDGLARFDVDGARTFNEAMPLALFKEAATSQALAPHLRRQVAIAAWTRAVLLEDDATARALAPVAAALAPELKDGLDAYLAAATVDERRFAAVYLMLKYPGTRPVVDSGVGRLTEIEKIDDYRDNWWCAPGAEKEFQTEAQAANNKNQPGYPDFLTAAQKAKAAQEVEKLKALGPAPNYLVTQSVKWANVKAADPRAPEALHLAVRSTRYGCKDDKTGTFSKLAFDTLHKKYPKSEWAQKTKYWFNE